MSLIADYISWLMFIFASLPILLAPWLFGAWEQWWFWPFVTSISFSFLLFSTLLVLKSRNIQEPLLSDDDWETSRKRRLVLLFFSILPFLIYSFIRSLQARVWMDAERLFVIQLSCFLLGLQIVLGFTRTQRSILLALMLINFFLLGTYGLVNHIITGSRKVLWAPAFDLYLSEGRASGSYFCPNHFSGCMEFAVGTGLACLLIWKTRLFVKLAGLVLIITGTTGIIISKSRGGFITLIAMCILAILFGFTTWPKKARLIARLFSTIIFISAIALLCTTENAFMKRFLLYFPYRDLKNKPIQENTKEILRRLEETSRGRMITAAWRAWRETEKTQLWGIWPGMHQNIWPHIAPTPDGDRENKVWPRLANWDFHSYWVHSDWMQLLEEYGLVGLFLFLLAAFTILYLIQPFFIANSENILVMPRTRLMCFAGTMAWIAMFVHSFGDFNLQIPANAWLLTGLLAIPLGQLHTKPANKE